MGWTLNHGDDDRVPPTISKIRKNGALANWNKNYPSQKVLPGDKIVKVNNLPWHNNTALFVKHVGHRIQAALKRKEGAEHELYVKVRRAAEKAEEDSKEDSKEDSGEEQSKEDSRENSKEDSKEESKEESKEDSKEEDSTEEDSKEEDSKEEDSKEEDSKEE